MYFVLKQHQELGRTFNVNVRMGGFITKKGAESAAKKHSPSIVQDESGRMVGHTVSPNIKGFIS